MKTIKIIFYGAGLCLTLGFFSACNNSNTSADKVEEAAENMSDAFKAEQEALAADLKRAREDINQRIKKLNAKMDGATDEMKSNMQSQIDKLNKWGEDLDKRMGEVGQNIEDGWESFKADVNKTLENIDHELSQNFEG